MKDKELQADKWYRFYPYLNHGGDKPKCEWLMKAEGGSHYAKLFISWYDYHGNRTFHDGRGNFPGSYDFEEVSAHEYKWLKLIEERKEYFPIEEVAKEEIINNYPIF